MEYIPSLILKQTKLFLPKNKPYLHSNKFPRATTLTKIDDLTTRNQKRKPRKI